MEEPSGCCGMNCCGLSWKWPKSLRCRSKKWRNTANNDQRTELTFEEALAELNRYKKQFLKEVKKQIRAYVKAQSKKDCTAIVATDLSSKRKIHTGFGSEWRRRFRAMLKHKDQSLSEKPSLPTYNGEVLDSALSEPIAKIVSNVYDQLLHQHGDIISRHVLSRLRNNPGIQRTIARTMASTARASVKPLTDQAYEALVHSLQQLLFAHVTMELQNQAGDTVTHLTNTVTMTTLGTTLVQALHGAILKLIIKSFSTLGFKIGWSVAAKIVCKSVFTSLASIGAGALLHASGATVVWPIYVVLAPIVLGYMWYKIHGFQRKLGKKIAANVCKSLEGEFESRNHSVLTLIVQDWLKDGGKEMCKFLVSDQELRGEIMATVQHIVEGPVNMRAEKQGQVGVLG